MIGRCLPGVFLVVASRAAGQCVVSQQRIAVAALSAAYTASASTGARIAIRDSLPEAPLGIRTGLSPRRDFVLGLGTSLSPGLPMLALQAAASLGLTGSAATARRAAHTLAWFGAAYTAGQLIEPETYRTLRHPMGARDRTLIVVSNVVAPAALAFAASRGCR